MKKLLILIFFISSFTVLSQEKYVCTADLSNYGRHGEYEYKTYERVGNQFKKISNTKKVSWFKIEEETDSFILLIKTTSSYPSIFVTFINKKNGTFFEKYSSPSFTKEDVPTLGTYIIEY
tara:strand:+ start:604 stop:963 length:360 start_codon:yes stop_codon:yes gene_type:complete